MKSVSTGDGSPLRVCLLHNYRESQQISMTLYAERLGSALQREGAIVDRVRPAAVISAGLRRVWALDKLDSYLGRFVEYPRIAQAARADIYHIVDHGQAFLISSLDPRRTVITCHDLMLLVAASGQLGRREDAAVALQVFREVSAFLGKAAAIVADSERTRQDIVKHLRVPAERIDVIPLGLNQPFAPSAQRRASGRARWQLEHEKVVLQIGNAFYKNVEACLHVLAALRARGVPAILLRAGRPLRADQAVYRLADRLGVRAHLRELGPLPDCDLPLLYNVADVLLFPSSYEGFGWPPLEAMASGTPVVCSRAGALAEFAAAASLTADPEDVDHLAHHVASVLSDPALADALRRRGLDHAASFTWDETARRMMDVYERVRQAREPSHSPSLRQ